MMTTFPQGRIERKLKGTGTPLGPSQRRDENTFFSSPVPTVGKKKGKKYFRYGGPLHAMSDDSDTQI
jgi:hypothetical protein